MRLHTLIQGQAAGLHELIEQARWDSPQWLARVTGAGTHEAFETLIARLSNDLRVFRDLIEQHDTLTQPADELVANIEQFMMANLHRRLTLKQLAVFLGYSEKYCSDLFHARMGISFSKYLQRLRIEKAKLLLSDPHHSMAQIADALGFSDQFAFSHFFKKTLGCSPKQFRERSNAVVTRHHVEVD